MRTTINIKAETPAELKSALRSLAAKLNAEDFQAGADIKVGGARVQVSTPEVADIRQWARENGYAVGTRGRFSKELQEAYAAHLKAEKARIAAEKRAAREAKREAVSA